MKYLIYLISIVITVSGCSKINSLTSAPTGTNTPISGTLKAAFNFMPGSYWIYKDSLTNQVDSFYVSAYSDGNQLVYGGSDYNTNEVIGIGIKGQDMENVTDDRIKYWQLYYMDNAITFDITDTNLYTNVIECRPLVNYPFDTTFHSAGLANPNYSDTIRLISVLSSFVVATQTFQNVAIINASADIANNNVYTISTTKPPLITYSDFFFLSPNIGFLKVIQIQPQDSVYHIWELQRYHIVK